MGGWVYILASRPYGTLYIGVTNDLARRVTQHREGHGSEFCKKYGVTRLVRAEPYPEIVAAIIREKRLKKWPRKSKIQLIESDNPRWDDIYERINADGLWSPT
jgi:putative endonuclease